MALFEPSTAFLLGGWEGERPFIRPDMKWMIMAKNMKVT